MTLSFPTTKSENFSLVVIIQRLKMNFNTVIGTQDYLKNFLLIHEDFNPPRHDTRRSELLGVNGPGQGLVYVHPAFYLVGQAQHEVQLAGLVLLLGGLIVIGVDEIVTPSLVVHRVAL